LEGTRAPQIAFEEHLISFLRIVFFGVKTSMEGSQIEENNEDILPVTDLEEQYRGSLYRLSRRCARLPPLPVGCQLTVTINVAENDHASGSMLQPWVQIHFDLQRNANYPTTSHESKVPASIVRPEIIDCALLYEKALA